MAACASLSQSGEAPFAASMSYSAACASLLDLGPTNGLKARTLLAKASVPQQGIAGR